MDKHEALDLYRSMCGEEEQKSAGEPAPKFCSHCGRINDTGGRICSFCRESAKNSKKRRIAGERLRRPKGEASCQICGKLSVPGEKYCRRCLDFAPGGYVGEPSAKAAILPAKIVALRSKIRELQIKNGAIPKKMKVAPGCAQDAESRVTLAENGAAPAATTCAEMWRRIVRRQSRKEDIRKLSKSGYAPGVICR